MSLVCLKMKDFSPTYLLWKESCHSELKWLVLLKLLYNNSIVHLYFGYQYLRLIPTVTGHCKDIFRNNESIQILGINTL